MDDVKRPPRFTERHSWAGRTLPTFDEATHGNRKQRRKAAARKRRWHREKESEPKADLEISQAT